MQTVFEKIKNLLDKEQIEYRLTEHKPVRTSEAAAAVRGVDIKTGAKAMVVKANKEYFLFVLSAADQLDWKYIKSILKAKEVRFATIEEAEELTNVKMGSVPPFGNVLELKTFFDKKLLENEYVNFNPGSLTHSIQMKADDLVKLVQPEITDFRKGDRI